MKKYLAEFVGTFMIVFMAAGSLVADVYLSSFRVTDSFGPLGLALAYGLAVTVAVAAFGRISGGHFNPAISFAAFLSRRLPGGELVGYVGGQLSGALVAGGFVRALMPERPYQFVGGGAPGVGEGVTLLQAVGVEIVLTFFLALAVWAVGVDRRARPALAPVAVGLVVVAGVIAGGSFSGGAMNPARWIGPALVAGAFKNWPVWIIGPLLGATLGSLLYETFFLDEPEGMRAAKRSPVAPASEPEEGEAGGAGEMSADEHEAVITPTRPPEPPPMAPRPPEPPSPPEA
ncbi:MAG: aquaporin [Actinomycetota bacterium]